MSAVRVEQLDDPAEFLRRAASLLETSEARHNLIYGLAGTLVSDPDAYPAFDLWIAEDGGVPVAAALRTPPYNVVVADARDSTSIDVLAQAVADVDPDVAGAAGNVPTIDRFASAWGAVTGSGVERTMAQGIFALERVMPVAEPPAGSARPATPDDRDLAIAWIAAFGEEAVPDDPRDHQRLLEFVDRRIAGQGGAGLWLWDVGGDVVSLTVHSGRTPHGIRIGPVYTPPNRRGNGYASALVAEQSSWLLAGGRRFCFLFTDLSNPTSNAIYRRIGYQQVAEAAMFTFTRPGSPGGQAASESE